MKSSPGKPPPDLNIPSSPSTVTVRVIDSTTTLHLDPPLFWTPAIQGLSGISAPALCFLISHHHHGAQPQHVLFDLGVRRDWTNSAPATVDLITRTTTVRVEKNIAEILDSASSSSCSSLPRSTDISTLIWSHPHFDHAGDPSTFPATASLLVGPGVINACWPGYPTNPHAMVLDSDIAGRTVTEIDFSPSADGACTIGGFNAVDYFRDGSFYLLDAPGHCVGHICALARVTSASASAAASPTGNTDSFIFMGGDAAHHPGLLRPSIYLPLPETPILIPTPSSMKHDCPAPPPGSDANQAPGVEDSNYCNYLTTITRDRLEQIHPRHSIDEPFLQPARGMFPAYEDALATLRKIQALDAAENVLVVLPHDRAMAEHLALFPREANGWLGTGVKERTRWVFVGDFVGGS